MSKQVTLDPIVVGGLLFTACMYLVVASLSISIFAKCEAHADSSMQKNLKDYLSYTLTIAVTVAVTVGMLHFQFSKILFILYSLMGIIACGINIHWATTCDNAKNDESKMIFPAVCLGLFFLFLVGSVLMAQDQLKTIARGTSAIMARRSSANAKLGQKNSKSYEAKKNNLLRQQGFQVI